jgi:hypothetical protein
MFRTMTAKYAGSTCKRCGATIQIGETIRYGGPGRIYHLAAECSASATPDTPGAYLVHADTVEAADGATPGSYSRPARRSVYTRFSSGAEVFTNARGRCEDAPCCGCCS